MIILLSYQNCSSGGFSLKTFPVTSDSAVSLSAVNSSGGFTQAQLLGTWQEPCLTSDSITSFQQADTFDDVGNLTVQINIYTNNSTCAGEVSSTQTQSGTYNLVTPNKWGASTQIQVNVSGNEFTIGAEITDSLLYFGSSSGDGSLLESAEPLTQVRTAP